MVYKLSKIKNPLNICFFGILMNAYTSGFEAEIWDIKSLSVLLSSKSSKLQAVILSFVLSFRSSACMYPLVGLFSDFIDAIIA